MQSDAAYYADPVHAAMEIVGADPAIMGVLTNGVDASDHIGRVWGVEVPMDAHDVMPCAALVVSPQPSTSGVGVNDYSAMSRTTLDFMCYGDEFSTCMRLAMAVQRKLKSWHRATTPGKVLVVDFTKVSGPFRYRDPDQKWPVVVVTWTMLYADELLP